ncbi:G5 domain-containing protein [Demequina sp. NBRC 110056]|uniref:aggregation-promoting factor C-terminal-like domain-containing protein n=1 Tax=Demequina sp. NBRC 110056 TaxID=1570345 RepID=UPI000A029C0D|nr:G5 domain-containing protein [Demequina sp. NBRC 110056]
MSYRRRAAAPGGRRDARERTTTRTRTTRTFAGGIALSAFAIGSFASAGVNAWAQESPSDSAQLAVASEVAAVNAGSSSIEVVTRTEEETIAHSSVEEKDYDEYEGSSKVVTEGEDGTALVSYTVTLKDGEEVEREAGIRVVVDEPVDEVVSVGARKEPTIPKTTNAGANRALGRELAAQRGWTGTEWECLNALFTKESNWRHNAQNRSSGAYGIPQSLPGTKMASVGADWRTNPATQITWGLNYIKGRYGTPCGAWGHSQNRGWY